LPFFKKGVENSINFSQSGGNNNAIRN
jgi:hypothetical protein